MGKIIKITAGLVVFIIIAIVVAVSFIDVNQYKGEVIKVVEDKTGRKFTIDGDFKLGLSLIPTIEVDGVKFGNANWGSKPEMLSVDHFEVQISLIPLLSGNISVNRLILNSPEILLETDKNGVGNWVLNIKEREATEEPAALPAFAINEVFIKDAKLTHKDGVSGKISKVTVDEITLEAGGFLDPMELTMQAAYNEIPIQLEGTLGTLDQLMDNDDYPVNLTANVSNAELSIDGQITNPKQGKGLDLAITFTVESLAKLSKLADSELPEFGPVNLSGKLSDIEGGYALKSLMLKAGNSDLSGNVTVITSGKRPALHAQLKSNLIDLAALSAEEEQKKKDKNAKVFSSDPLPLDGLKVADANISLDAKKIQTKAATFDNTKLVLKLNHGKLSVNPLDTQLAGGTLNSTITLDGSTGKSASLSTGLKIKNLQPGLLPAFKEKMTGAKTDVTINIKGSGKSVAAIMAGSNGNILVKIDPGTFKSASSGAATSDLFSSLKNTIYSDKSGSGGATEIVCGVVNLKIKEGIATADKGIAINTKKMNIIGSGIIDLKTEKLDIGIDPQAREGVGISAGQLAELVRVGGTLADPKMVPDTKAAFKTAASAGAAVATGGLSILAQGLFDRSTADEDPCATALGLKTAKTKPAEKQEEDKSATTKAVDSVKDAGTAIKDTFKGLFD